MFTKEEEKAILDALIFTIAGDAQYDTTDKEKMKTAVEKLVSKYPEHKPLVTLYKGFGDYDDEENSNFIEKTVKTITVEK